MLELSDPEGLHPVERTYAGAVCEEQQRVGKTHIGAFCRELYPIGFPCWSRAKECEEEGQAERKCDGLTTAPIPHASAPLRGEGHKE